MVRTKINLSVSKYLQNFLRKTSLTAGTQSALHPAHSENYYLVLCTWLGIDSHPVIPIHSSLPLGPVIELRNFQDLLLPLQTFGLDRHGASGISNTCRCCNGAFCSSTESTLRLLHVATGSSGLERCWQGLVKVIEATFFYWKIVFEKNAFFFFPQKEIVREVLDSGLNLFWILVAMRERELWNSKLSGKYSNNSLFADQPTLL